MLKSKFCFNIETNIPVVPRLQFGIRHLLLAVLLTAIATSFLVLRLERKKLDAHARAVESFARSIDSDWQLLHVLKGLSVEPESQRKAIQTLLDHWDEMKYRSSYWPQMDNRRLHTCLFSNAYPDGATASVVVLMNEDEAVDAISYVSDAKREEHSCWEDIGPNNIGYSCGIITYPPGKYRAVLTRQDWTLNSQGLVKSTEQKLDRTKR